MNILDNLNNKNISQSSLNLYNKNLLRLNDNKEIKNYNFLKNVDEILNKIKHYKPNTQRSYLISIVSLLKQDPKQKKLYDKYYIILDQYNKNLKSNNEKSETQANNWISQEEVIEKQNELMKILEELTTKKISEEQYNKLLNLIILSLYTLNCPRRNLDYLKMNVVNKFTPDLSKENNYLDLTNQNFIFRNYKTKKTYQDQIIPISSNLFDIIKIFLKFHPLKPKTKNFNIPFLVNFNGDSFKNSNEITRILNKIFNKKIGSSMLRNIYLTSKYSDEMNELKKDTQNMGTSVDTAKNNYIKNTVFL